MKLVRLIFLLGLRAALFLKVSMVVAQFHDPLIKQYNLEDGMSQVSANDMVRDSIGFVWIATADGLNRFDGKNFQVFKSDKLDTTTVSGNFITKLLLSENQNLFVGTNGNGLNVYNPRLGIFSRIKLNDIPNVDEIITGITTVNQNDIWVSTMNGGVFQIKMKGSKVVEKKSFLIEKSITALSKDESGMIWLGTTDGLIRGFENASMVPSIEFNVEGRVEGFLKIQNTLYIGTYEGFYSYDLFTKELQEYILEANGNFKAKHVVDFLILDKNRFWIATGRGLYLFDRAMGKTIEKIEYTEDSSSGLSNNTVQSLLNLPDQKMLVGTANGLNFVDFKRPYFNNISKDKKGSKILNDNVIFSIYKNEHLWVGTSDGGLNLITDRETYYFTDDIDDPESITGTVVRAIVCDQVNERMWLGTTRGVSMIDLKTFNPDDPKFINFTFDKSNPNSINSDFIKGLALDNFNNLWGATFDNGIFRLEYHDEGLYNIVRYVHSDLENSLINNVGQCISVDGENNIWIGTRGGLSKLSFENKPYGKPIFKNYTHNPSEKGSLSNNSIYDILFDQDQDMWIGTRDGLNFFRNDSFKSWLSEDQFPNTIVYSIQNDLNGDLWLATNDGIVKFNKKSQKFSHYGVSDNIQGKEFDIHARFRDDQGTVYLGGTNGVTYFNPVDMDSIDQPSTLYFSNLKVKENTITPGNPNQNYLKSSIERTSEIQFSYDQFPFYLSFSTIDFRPYRNVEYAYKLLPLDKDWNFLDDNQIQFLNLPSGKYELLVNGFSRGSEWSSDPLKLSILVTPPWWATNLAYVLYVLVTVLMIMGIYQFFISRKLAFSEAKRLRDIDQIKNSLYTNITHEFRTPLTVILGLVDNLRNNGVKQNDLVFKKPLNLIQKNAETLLQLVNDMLDLTKIESSQIELSLKQVDIVTFSRYLFQCYHSLAEQKKLQYVFYSEIESLMMDVDLERFRVIFSNLVVNAIKFTEKNGKIVVHINRMESEDEDHFYLKIVDTGIGISPEESDRIFDKFYQIDSTVSRKFEGTGIGLALTKDFVELMDGSITVKSKLGHGSEFVVLLPISNNALKSDINDLIKFQDESKEIEQEVDVNEMVEIDITIEADSEKPTVLLIDDNLDVVYYLNTCLEGSYQVLHAENGSKGIEKAIKLMPDIIICDVMMPEIDGFEVCENLKSNIVTDHIPIIMLTAKSTEKDRLEGLSRGADAYLIKPFNKKELFTRLDHLIRVRKRMISKFGNVRIKESIDSTANDPQTRFIKKAIKLVHQSIDDQNFGPIQLASQIGLSESQLYRKLKKITDKSTAVYIRSVRLQEAKKLIETTDNSISEVAYMVGFNDPSWFSRAFKEEFGKAPSRLV